MIRLQGKIRRRRRCRWAVVVARPEINCVPLECVSFQRQQQTRDYGAIQAQVQVHAARFPPKAMTMDSSKARALKSASTDPPPYSYLHPAHPEAKANEPATKATGTWCYVSELPERVRVEKESD
jgi:hypothetical protein